MFWGLAIATKWSAIFPLAAFGLLMWFWDAGARRSFGVRRALLKSAVVDALPALGYVVLLPLLIYVASWTGWLLHADVYERHLSDTQYGPYWGSYLRHDAHGFFPELWQSLRSLWHYHHDVYAFHTGFLNDSKHAYQSDPWGWLLLNRPVGVDTQLDIRPASRAAPLPRAPRACGRCCCSATRWCGGSRRSRPCGPRRLDRAARLALRAGRRRGRGDLAPVAAVRRPADLQLLRGDDPAVPGARRDHAARGDARAGNASPLRRAMGAAAVGGVVVLVMLAFAWFWPIWTDQLITNREWVQRMWFRRWI